MSQKIGYRLESPGYEDLTYKLQSTVEPAMKPGHIIPENINAILSDLFEQAGTKMDPRKVTTNYFSPPMTTNPNSPQRTHRIKITSTDPISNETIQKFFLSNYTKPSKKS